MATREELVGYGYLRECAIINDKKSIPMDILNMVISWIPRLPGAFDMTVSNDAIQLHSDIPNMFMRRVAKSRNVQDHASIIGTSVVSKGIKKTWTLQIDNLSNVMIGIIDNQVIDNNKIITDFTDEFNKGYGLETSSWDVFHVSDAPDGSLAEYAEQFNIWNDETMTVLLDMTQKEYKHGVLKYILHNEPIMNDLQIETHGRYSNIAYDNLDIDKKYRLAVAISQYNTGEWIELLSEFTFFS